MNHLALDGVAGFGLPLPDAFEEGVAAHLAAVQTFFGELPFDHHLRGDTGMIGSGQPQSVVAAHAMPAHDGVDLGVLQHVAHVEGAGHIGGRDDEREDAAAGLGRGVEDSAGRSTQRDHIGARNRCGS